MSYTVKSSNTYQLVLFWVVLCDKSNNIGFHLSSCQFNNDRSDLNPKDIHVNMTYTCVYITLHYDLIIYNTGKYDKN